MCNTIYDVFDEMYRYETEYFYSKRVFLRNAENFLQKSHF